MGEGPLASVSWYQHVALLDKLATADERRWYAAQAVEHGWSRNVLAHHIDTDLRGRQGRALTNFARTLPAPQSDLAQEITKSHDVFDFLELSAEADERALERGLIARFRDVFRELGRGFAFLGSQYPLEVDGREYRLDLLSYHVRLHCYVVVELEVGEFAPADAGQLGFYVTAVDRQLRDAARDEPTLGLLLCRSRSELVIEYTPQGVRKPPGVTTYEHLAALRPRLEALPTPEELRSEFADAERDARGGRRRGARRRLTSGGHMAGMSNDGSRGAAKPARRRARQRPPGAGAPTPARDLVLHVALRDVVPSVWRRLRVPDRLTLHQLHRVLQLTFGWLDYHLYEFTRTAAAGRGARTVRGGPAVRYAEPDPEWDDAGGAPATRDSRRVTLRDLALAPGARLTYVYDFGDDWAHEITLEQVVTRPRRAEAEDEGESLPMVLDGARAGPPEDAGGAHGYARLLEVLADPDDPEHEELKAWAALWGGAAYDPARFDPWTANHTLMLVAAWGAL